MTNFDMVKEFHTTFGLDVRDKPGFPNWKTALLRQNLIGEELKELYDEMFADETSIEDLNVNLCNIAKELADLLYVTYGTAATYGIPIDKVFAEVHRSNMSKLTADGQVLRREDGKVLKSDQYKPADVRSILFANE